MGLIVFARATGLHELELLQTRPRHSSIQQGRQQTPAPAHGVVVLYGVCSYCMLLCSMCYSPTVLYGVCSYCMLHVPWSCMLVLGCSFGEAVERSCLSVLPVPLSVLPILPRCSLSSLMPLASTRLFCSATDAWRWVLDRHAGDEGATDMRAMRVLHEGTRQTCGR
jgi:hypothetical protein